MSAKATAKWGKFGHGGDLRQNHILLTKVKSGSSKSTENYQKLMERLVLPFYRNHKRVWN